MARRATHTFQRIAVAHQAVHVDAVGLQPEQRRRRALHQQQRRFAEAAIDRIELAAPAGHIAALVQRGEDLGDRGAARFDVAQPVMQVNRAVGQVEDRRELGENAGEIGVDPADMAVGHDEVAIGREVGRQVDWRAAPEQPQQAG